MRELAKKMILEGIHNTDAEELTKNNLKVIENKKIEISDLTLDRDDYDEIVLIGIGKASVAMAVGCKDLDPDDGLVITTSADADLKNRCPVEVREASHPYPKKENLKASEKLLSIIEKKKNALFIFLISGGGSALLTNPAEGITLTDLNELNKLLVNSGANIHQINTIRKHVSKVKGGRLGKLCSEKGDIVSLIISDVVGDDMSVIASGPTYPDNSTYRDAKKTLEKLSLWVDISQNIRNRIEDGLKGEVDETPKKLETKNFVIGNNMMALQGAKKFLKENSKLNSLVLTSQSKGEAKVIAKLLSGIAKEVQDTGNPVEPPVSLILGGETTVKIESDEPGKGGPNRELVLSAAIELQKRENIVIASADSDGIDGMEKSGAIADISSVKKSKLDPKKYLDTHDSQTFFESLGDNLDFRSKTNVNDITVIIVGKERKSF